MRTHILLLLLFACPLSGCSLVFTSGPPPPSQRGNVFSCTTSYAAPILDVAWMSYALAAAGEKTGGIDAGDIVLSALWVGSAGYGVRNIRRCKHAMEEAVRRTVELAVTTAGSSVVRRRPIEQRLWLDSSGSAYTEAR